MAPTNCVVSISIAHMLWCYYVYVLMTAFRRWSLFMVALDVVVDDAGRRSCESEVM